MIEVLTVAQNNSAAEATALRSPRPELKRWPARNGNADV